VCTPPPRRFPAQINAFVHPLNLRGHGHGRIEELRAENFYQRGALFNKRFGSIFRSDIDASFQAFQIKRHVWNIALSGLFINQTLPW
jgi:hypothetical protein